jgi:hypothetical protein
MAPSTHLSLLRTCRQIDSEAKYLPLALGTLSFDDMVTFYTLMLHGRLSEEQRHAVLSLTVVLQPDVRVQDWGDGRTTDQILIASPWSLIEKLAVVLRARYGLPMLPKVSRNHVQFDKKGMDIIGIKFGGRRGLPMEETWDRCRKDLLRQRPGLEVTVKFAIGGGGG